MKKVCIQIGHWQIENITNESLRSWRSPEVLKKSTGASGERDWHWNEWMPKLRDKLIAVGVQVYIVGATFQADTYNQEYDLWISGHYDGGGMGERCMISSPNRETKPDYLASGAFSESERFCQIWKSIYPNKVGVPNRDDLITAGMKDYYAFDYVGYNTPSVIVEHFNHTSVKGEELKKNAELVAQADFEVICKFLGLPLEPPIEKETYQVVYKGQVLQEYDYNPTDKITELATKNERLSGQLAEKISEMGTLKADLEDANQRIGEVEGYLTTAKKERDDARSALGVAQENIVKLEEKIGQLQETIKKYEEEDPLAPYSGWELVRKGLNKLFSK